VDVYRPQRGNSTKTFHVFTVYTTAPHSTKKGKKKKHIEGMSSWLFYKNKWRT
jgi:hypothetical protein